jgi:hypothetical protein
MVNVTKFRQSFQWRIKFLSGYKKKYIDNEASSSKYNDGSSSTEMVRKIINS